jgi:hypothetical protein
MFSPGIWWIGSTQIIPTDPFGLKSIQCVISSRSGYQSRTTSVDICFGRIGAIVTIVLVHGLIGTLRAVELHAALAPAVVQPTRRPCASISSAPCGPERATRGQSCGGEESEKLREVPQLTYS